MRKMYTKLIAITLLLILSASMVVMATFAWFVLSKNPVATGIQVSIGGGNTILIAPDLSKTVQGKTVHYPGVFSEQLHFSQHESYAYLQQAGGLTPVSTADGVHWILPDYYSDQDAQVLSGQALSGELKPVEEFTLEQELEHANLSASQKEKLQQGSYLYLDFWVVTHGGDYTLRLSSGQESGGSLVMDLPSPAEGDSITGYTLKEGEHQAAAAVRVGFLANDVSTGDEAMIGYQESPVFDPRHTQLRGFYQEPDAGSLNLAENRFTIYEPNCDAHPSQKAEEGSYVATRPLGVVDGKITPVSLAGQLMAQKSGRWLPAENGAGTALEQRFQAALLGKNTKEMTFEEISNTFYGSYLQGQISPYVEKGSFFEKSGDLHKFGESIAAEQLEALQTADATEDVYIIRLEQNVPQRIRMFIWLEGQDVDCVNQAATAGLALELELAGGSE